MYKPSTQAEEKLLLQFENIAKTDQFAKIVLLTRSRIGIPPVGFPATEYDHKNLWKEEYFPKEITDRKNAVVEDICKIVNDGIAGVIELLTIDNLYFRILLKNYIFFNEFFHEESRIEYLLFGRENLCSIVDTKREFELKVPSHGNVATENQIYVKDLKRKLDLYPLALRIHPDASIRDLKEFLEKNSSLIHAIQNSYRVENTPTVKNSKTKVSKKISERDEFIYSMRSFPRKTIVTLLREKGYEPPDVGTIGKVISLQKKKREKK